MSTDDSRYEALISSALARVNSRRKPRKSQPVKDAPSARVFGVYQKLSPFSPGDKVQRTYQPGIFTVTACAYDSFMDAFDVTMTDSAGAVFGEYGHNLTLVDSEA